MTGIGTLPKSNMLKFVLKDGWIAVRPSGTEPVIKFYIASRANSLPECESKISYLTEIINNVVKKEEL